MVWAICKSLGRVEAARSSCLQIRRSVGGAPPKRARLHRFRARRLSHTGAEEATSRQTYAGSGWFTIKAAAATAAMPIGR